MRKKRNRRASPLAVLLVTATAVFSVLSCATKPAPEETALATKPAPVEPVSAPKPESEYQTAKQQRETIIRYGLDRFEAESFNEAESSFKDGEAAYEKDNVASKAAFEKASAGYRKVLDSGFLALTNERRQAADDAKRGADAVKAAVAVKAEYAAALDIYNQAAAADKAKDHEKSLELYEKATEQFKDAAQAAGEKKARAESLLREIEAGLQDSEEQAAEAEKVKEGGLCAADGFLLRWRWGRSCSARFSANPCRTTLTTGGRRSCRPRPTRLWLTAITIRPTITRRKPSNTSPRRKHSPRSWPSATGQPTG